jgi:hypothetical protein
MKTKPIKIITFVSVFVIFSMIISPFVLKFFTVTIGESQVLITANERTALGLHTWPDGNIGVIKENQSYTFYATNGGLLSKTSGTLDNPVEEIHYTDRPIQNLKEIYNYAGGGPVFEYNGILFMLYHAEFHNNNDFQQFYSTIGIAYSLDNGDQFFDLGKIIQSTYQLNNSKPIVAEMAGAPFVIDGDYLYVFFRDTISANQQHNLAVARCTLEALSESTSDQLTPTFYKYFNGAFLEPGISGKSTPLEFLNGNIRWFDIGFDTKRNEYLIVLIDDALIGQNLYMMWSKNLFDWGPRINLTYKQGELFYPTLIGISDNPKISNGEWWVYYTFSEVGSWSRWQDARLERVRLEF